MQFLIDASLPRAVAPLFTAHGHQAVDVRDIGLRRATDPEIAAHAQAHRWALVSADFDFADIRIYPPSNYHGRVVIDRPEGATVAEVIQLVGSFLRQNELIANLAGRLIIVDERRIRIRPPL